MHSQIGSKGMKSAKNILILTDWYHPGYKAGGPITSLYNLLHLVGSSLRPKLFTRNEDWFDSTPYDLQTDSWLETDGAEIYYSSGRHFLKIINALGDARLVYLNGFYSAQFNSGPLIYLLLLKRNIQIVVAPRGMLGRHALKLKSIKKKILIKLLRFIGIESRVIFHAASTGERDGILSIYPKATVSIVSNVPLKPLPVNKSFLSSSLIGVGRISRVKNTLSLIRLIKQFPDLTLNHVGSADDRAYELQCKTMATQNINFIQGGNREQIQAHLASSGFFISMTTGENFGHAIIEALGAGCPVIISDQTPWNDLESFGAGWVIPLDNVNRWSQVLKEASVMDAEGYSQMSKLAQEYVRQKFDFDDLRRQYLKLFQTGN